MNSGKAGGRIRKNGSNGEFRNIPEWISRHREVFARKESLRFYYREVFAGLLLKHLLPGPTLEIGSGPGFMSDIRDGITTSDIEALPGIDVSCDAHDLQFSDGSFENVFFVDVLHHLTSPLACFREIARVLRPGGRLVLIEPFTTPLSVIFYKWIHHESCRKPEEVWNRAFTGDKLPMEGNAEIPRTCLVSQSGPVTGRAPEAGLRLKVLMPFAGLSYLLTGGFQPWQCPLPVIRFFYRLETFTHPVWAPLAATRCLAVLEKPSEHV